MSSQGSDDVRKEANAALRRGFADSLGHAVRMWAAIVVALAAFAGIAATMKWMDEQGFRLLISIGIVLFFVVLCIIEWQRLNRCKVALSNLLISDKVYESLLSDARQERDRAQSELQRCMLIADARWLAQSDRVDEGDTI